MRSTLVGCALGIALLSSVQAGFLTGDDPNGGTLCENKGAQSETETTARINDCLTESGTADDFVWLGRDGSAVGGTIEVKYTSEQGTSVFWNLAGTGYEMWAVSVKGGNGLLRIYLVDDLQKTAATGWESIVGPPNGGGNISGVSHVDFLGRKAAVPDAGSVLAMAALGLVALVGIGLRKRV